MKIKLLFIVVYFVIASIVATYPLILHVSSALPHAGDELLITWILNWNIHSILHNPIGIFDTNIFYPYTNTLAYSDLFISSSLLALPIHFLFTQPVAVYNLSLLFAYASLGFCTYFLVAYLSKSSHAGIISGTLVAFSTYSITKTMHLQLLTIFYFPLALYFFFRFLHTKKIRFVIALCTCIFLQFINSIQPAYFIVFSLTIFWIYLFFTKRTDALLFLQKKIIGLFLLTLLFLFPFANAYLEVSHEFGYARDIRDTIHFANRPEYTFYPSDRTRLQEVFLQTIYKNDRGPYWYDGYVGGVFFCLFFMVIFWYLKKTKKPIPFFTPFLFVSVVGFITSLGPALQWGGKVIKIPFIIPLPYALFYYLIPGFNGMRNSGRWEMLFVFAASVAIGLFLGHYFARKLHAWAAGITICICLLVFAEINMPMHVTPVPQTSQMPQVQKFINTLPSDIVILEMPAYVWNMFPFAMDEIHRQYYSTINFRKRVNGGSGFSPPPWEKKIYTLMQRFPQKETIVDLQSLGVTHIVLHKKEYDTLYKSVFMVGDKRIVSGDTIQKDLEKQQVKKIKTFGDDILYQIK